MAIRLFLALAAVAGIMWYLAWYQRASPEQQANSLRTATLYGIGGILLLLVITGRIPWLFALFSAAVPWINRLMMAKRMWSMFSQARPKTGNSGKQQPRAVETMTRGEALEILGLSANASRDDIIGAHRKLMSKVHPDKGGSDYLARSINQARKILLDDDT